MTANNFSVVRLGDLNLEDLSPETKQKAKGLKQALLEGRIDEGFDFYREDGIHGAHAALGVLPEGWVLTGVTCGSGLEGMSMKNAKNGIEANIEIHHDDGGYLYYAYAEYAYPNGERTSVQSDDEPDYVSEMAPDLLGDAATQIANDCEHWQPAPTISDVRLNTKDHTVTFKAAWNGLNSRNEALGEAREKQTVAAEATLGTDGRVSGFAAASAGKLFQLVRSEEAAVKLVDTISQAVEKALTLEHTKEAPQKSKSVER